MSTRTATIDRLFDRSSRLPYALRSRTSATRRWIMLGVFILLSTTIGVYSYLTDASRVRDRAEQYLTELTGARVSVGKATLSVFEGLRLDDIRMYADPPRPVGKKTSTKKEDATPPIFTASRFEITYNLRQMLRGRIDGTRIVATDPHVLIDENVDAGTWNYQNIHRESTPTSDNNSSPIVGKPEPLQLPEVVLRDARVDYVESRGHARSTIGSMSLEGHLIASPGGDRYVFTLQSRGVTMGRGPSVSGAIDIASGKVIAQLTNFAFGSDIKTMLPAPVREWWESHALSGELDVPTLVYTPASGNQPLSFRVETDLKRVTLTAQPREWLSREEQAYTQSLRDMLATLDSYQHRTGYVGPGDKSAPAALADLLNVEPIVLQNVSGSFVFTNHGIEINNATAQALNTMKFVLNGRLDGYNADAPFSLTLANPPGEHLIIPEAAPYAGSMPGPVRELFLQLKPSGEADVQVSVHRADAGDPIVAAGEIDVIRGAFQYEKFPYPVREARGKIEFGPDPKTHIERLALSDLRGMGLAGGPNENSTMQLNGLIAPLSGDAGIAIKVQADHFIFEPAMQRALPGPVREVIELFEQPKHPELLHFSGGFVCSIDRPVGYDRDVYISTDLRIDDASGAADVFPYPLHHVAGLIQVRDDHADIVNVHADDGDRHLRINGHVAWTPHHDREGESESESHPPIWLKSDISLVAQNVPIDKQLLDSLPGDVQYQLARLGLSGTLDLDGTLSQRPIIKPTGDVDSPMRYDLNLHVKDGGIQPYGGAWNAQHMTGDIFVSPEIVQVVRMAGTRGDAAITGSGYMNLLLKDPPIVAKATATNLTLDPAFYQLISPGGRETWDEVHPVGTLDLDVAFNQPDHDFEMTARPRVLSVKPDEFPLAMDHLSGEVHVVDDDVTFTNVQARHGDSSLWVDGTGRLDKTDWDLKMAGRNLTIDKALTDALPTMLQGLVTSIGAKGKAAVDFGRFRLVAPSTQPAAVKVVATSAAIPPASQPAITISSGTPATQPAVAIATAPAAPADPATLTDFAMSLWLDDASMKVDVPIEHATGLVKLAARVEDGHLAAIDGSFDASKATLAGRAVTDLHAVLGKRPDQMGLRLDDIRASIGAGTMAGRVDWIVSDGPSKYVLTLSLHNADVQQLTQETDGKIQGSVSASLSLEGQWGDPRTTRGRGDVSVTGDQIVKLPLLLGLFQIANLALPVTGPLNDATARYSIDGPIVTFERVELKGNNVLMTGDGRLDFNKKTVDMRFSNDNPTAFKIPFIGDLIQSANRELLQIHIKGSVLSPKVSSSSFGTVSTTVDEVLSGDTGQVSDSDRKKR